MNWLAQYPAQISTYAQDIDFTIALIAVIVGFWALLTYALFFWLIVRFRARPGVRAGYLTGDERQPKKFISTAHMLVLVCDVFIVAAAVRVWVDVKQTLPEEPATQTVRVIGQQWAWKFVHPGPDGVLDTADDIRSVDELRIEVNRPYIYELTSLDVLHDFSVPVFRLKQDAIPGRVITGWFRAKRTGAFDIQCAEMCGIGHGLMPGRVVIETPAAHAAWMARRAGDVAGTPVVGVAPAGVTVTPAVTGAGVTGAAGAR